MSFDFGNGDTGWFVEDRFGMFIHWGLYSLPARHEWVKSREQICTADYQKYFERFNPDLYDPAAWAREARNAGMKYMVITSKHHEGFCLWDSQFTDYKATNTPCRRNLLRDAVDAFRNEGLKIGFYYSLIDWHHPEFTVDRIHPHREIPAEREANAGRDMKKYAEYMRNQVRELLTNFGKIDIIWFDFSYPGEDGKSHLDWESEKLVSMIRQLQPGIIINNRLDLPGGGDIYTPEQYLPPEWPKDEQGQQLVWEGCQTFSGAWGYHRDEASWKSVKMCIEMLVGHVSLGGNLLLNVGPTARGCFDQRALERLRGIGDWMRFHSRSVYQCTQAPAEFTAPQDCRYTWNPEKRRLYLHLFSWPFKAVHLPGLADKVAYAQLLNDDSEIKFRSRKDSVHAALNAQTPDGALTLELPVIPPVNTVPVIELFLK